MATFGHAFGALKQCSYPQKTWQKRPNFCIDFTAEGFFDVKEVTLEEFGAGLGENLVEFGA